MSLAEMTGVVVSSESALAQSGHFSLIVHTVNDNTVRHYDSMDSESQEAMARRFAGFFFPDSRFEKARSMRAGLVTWAPY